MKHKKGEIAVTLEHHRKIPTLNTSYFAIASEFRLVSFTLENLELTSVNVEF